jgi:hypothetical protein
MKNKSNALIVLLVAMAAFLGYAHLQLVPTANASFSIKDREYSVVTALVLGGSDGVYILDHQTNKVALFTWDPAQKSVVVRDIKPMDEIMAGR